MGSQSRRQRTVDRKRTDQLDQSSRRIAQANEDRLRLRRQRYVEQQAERRGASSSEPVASGSQRGIRRKVMEMVDKLKSLSDKSVEYESKILIAFCSILVLAKHLKGGTNSIQEQYQIFFRGQVPFRAWWQEYDKITEKEVSCSWNTE
ncbi:hypothetical protein R1sor_017703 [Riccia sorocarpa]|uniref:Non-structural maintenance of chromosomes element 4 n=1 Tax=Riccia sorocarpa TaxID=122646 RepID=A0ABD3I815_9MARC